MVIGEIEPDLLITQGLDQNQANHLVDLTFKHQAEFEFVSDLERFGSIERLNQWLEKERTIYTLQSSQDLVLGLIWFRPENFLGFNTTFAIRLYLHARGRGLATPFMKIVFDHYLDKFPDARVWLKVHPRNQKALRVYRNFGFQTLSEIPDRIVMGFDRITI